MYCPQNLVYDTTKGRCGCPSSAPFLNTLTQNCVSCPADQTFDIHLNLCVCKDQNLVLINGMCSTCPGNSVYDAATLQCITCPDIQVYSTVAKKCACPAGFPFFDQQTKKCLDTIPPSYVDLVTVAHKRRHNVRN